MDDLIAKRLENPVRQGLAETGLYHSIRLPDGRLLRGAMGLDFQEQRLASFGLPQDLTGKRVLDIGPWDGYFSFEMERRGAEVVAIDYVDLDTFRALRKAMNSRVHYERLDVYELDPTRIGTFDVVLCLGVLYHLKHPLLALEKICAVTRGVCIVDTYVVDGEQWLRGVRPPLPYLEFYETNQLGGQSDNWCGPTVDAVEALVRAAGFAQAQVLCVTGTSGRVAAHRVWSALPPERDAAIEVTGVTSHQDRGRSFQSHKENYLTLWCRGSDAEAPNLDTVYPEIDGLGVAPLSCAPSGDGLVVNLRLPPGLSPGQHTVRLKLGSSIWSKSSVFFMDLPPSDNTIVLLAAQDGVTWDPGRVDWQQGGWLTLWVEGLSAEADPGNTIVDVDGIPHYPELVEVQRGQINVRLRPIVDAGKVWVHVRHRGAASNGKGVDIVGRAPAIRGLESLRG